MAEQDDLKFHPIIIPDPNSKNVKTLHPTGQLLQGALNYNVLFSDESGKLYIWRTPKENPGILPEIYREYQSLGFIAKGGKYRFRSLKQQADFMCKAYETGLKNLTPIFQDDQGILLPFVQGIPFDEYLLNGNINAIQEVLDNNIKAHQYDIVYGDRWVKNTIVKPDEDIVEIDFDIEFFGENAKEFEIAQFLYHIVHFSKIRLKTIDFLVNYLRGKTEFWSFYKIDLIKDFLLNYYHYFVGQEYEGLTGIIESEIHPLVLTLSS